ncbi:MAG: hypothetical protein ABI690_00285 [Chloroflexota bacterium]
MEQIVRESICPSVASHIPRRRLPTNLLIVLILLTVFTVISLGVRTLALYLAPSTDPFAFFAEMLPGQSGSAIEGQPFSCYWEDDEYQIARQHCAMQVTTGAFAGVGIVISKAGIIQYATFMLRPNTLLLGDLMVLLGSPTFHRYGADMEFSWPDRGVTASAMVGRQKFSPFVPLWIVSFTLI